MKVLRCASLPKQLNSSALKTYGFMKFDTNRLFLFCFFSFREM